MYWEIFFFLIAMENEIFFLSWKILFELKFKIASLNVQLKSGLKFQFI